MYYYYYIQEGMNMVIHRFKNLQISLMQVYI